ncbi:hypothetical protein SAMN05421819_2012 [Bryocella elongata]|uniref:Glyoxalase n=1 Tax=Bryocella elongata TaxID=863522 RepID=A0A1H5XX34_9BACT|nr:glyoxalase [Bryocella elongata]SEG16203.1 hypothetical protein SAMN05421819_2012 [Bryocella elongata]
MRGTLLALALVAGTATLPTGAQTPGAQEGVAVGPQYDSTHVYVAAADVDAFARCFLATFGGKSSKQTLVTVTPTPSKTTSQLLQTPVGIVSLFGFTTPIPFGFGEERNGYLVRDLDTALTEARKAGADVIVAPFPDAIGRDAIVQWPGGVDLQLYWHTTPPSYPALVHVPENRVYVSPERLAAFVQAFVAFSHGKVVDDRRDAAGEEIGLPGKLIHRVRIESGFGKMVVFATDGHLVYPYGRETTGFEVDDLDAALTRAAAAGGTVLVAPFAVAGRRSSMVLFPGEYVAEIHAPKS